MHNNDKVKFQMAVNGQNEGLLYFFMFIKRQMTRNMMNTKIKYVHMEITIYSDIIAQIKMN